MTFIAIHCTDKKGVISNVFKETFLQLGIIIYTAQFLVSFSMGVEVRHQVVVLPLIAMPGFGVTSMSPFINCRRAIPVRFIRSNRASAVDTQKQKYQIFMNKINSSDRSGTPMTMARAAAIQSAAAKTNDGKVARGSFPARAQSAVAHNVASGQTSSGNGKAGR